MISRLIIFQLCLLVGVPACSETSALGQVLPQRSSRTRPTESGTISGRVMLKSGIPYTGRATITLSSLAIPSSSIYTDGGAFSFAGLREGNYTIEVIGDADKFLPTFQHVYLTRNGRTYLSIVMLEKPTPANKEDEAGVVSVDELGKVPDAAKKKVEQAVSLVGKGEADEAIRHYKQALAIYPNYILARNDLGVLYMKLRNLGEAAAQFEEALKIAPKAFNPRLNLGIVRIEEKNYPGAIEEIQEALSINSSHPAPYLYLGIARFEAGQMPEALRELSKAIDMGGNDYALAHYYTALIYIKTGKDAEAARALNAYLEAAPNGGEADNARMLLKQIAPPQGK